MFVFLYIFYVHTIYYISEANVTIHSLKLMEEDELSDLFQYSEIKMEACQKIREWQQMVIILKT